MQGFVQNAALVFKSHAKKGDYHDNKNRQNFEKWFKTQLIPNLKSPSLIIMNNASYHNTVEEEIPTKSWNKGKLITWLQKRNIDFPEKATKDEIWTIVSPRRPAKEYHLDKYVKTKFCGCHPITVNLMPSKWCGQNANENMTIP
jgi:hypothetical protein